MPLTLQALSKRQKTGREKHLLEPMENSKAGREPRGRLAVRGSGKDRTLTKVRGGQRESYSKKRSDDGAII